MPIYEYHCLDCHHRFERMRNSADRDAATPCPICAGERAKRALSVFATVRASSTSDAGPARATASQGGGCACGGNCGCH
jgi:putative FmdB family regulatory protein